MRVVARPPIRRTQVIPLLPFVVCMTLASAKTKADPGTSGPGIPENAPPSHGWTWAVLPMPPASSFSTRGFVGMLERQPDGLRIATLAHTADPQMEYRPVVGDSTGRAVPMPLIQGNSSDGIAMARYAVHPDSVGLGRIRWIGIEALDPDGRRMLAGEAQKRAATEGVEVLPYPVVGEPFPVHLTGVDGRRVTSESLRGKVVVIDCGATWCTPCMKKMPGLLELHRRLEPRGFAVVGINFDYDPAKARSAVDSLRLPWPEVPVPTEKKVRELWKEAASVAFLPRLFVLDRNGVLRGDVQPLELEAKVLELIGR